MYREQFNRIIEASQTESLTFFVGAGVSKLSDAPMWSELIDAFSEELVRDKKTLSALKKYLRNEIELSKRESPIKAYPKHDCFEALNLVGYFCRAGSLKRKDFSSFLNYSSMFDLFYKFEKFDFENFDVTWLLNWQDQMIQMLSNNKKVKAKTRECIAKEINVAQLNDSDLNRLSTILAKYFC